MPTKLISEKSAVKGAPTKAEFTPEQIDSARKALGINQGRLQLDVAEPNPLWAKYDLYTIPMLISGPEGSMISSGRKFVLRSQKMQPPKLIADVGEDYELYPNEKLEEDCDKWAKVNGYGRVDGKTYKTKSGNGAILCYAPETAIFRHSNGYNPTQQEVERWRNAEKQGIKVGFHVRNSIDGTMGFELGGFTLRMACDNGVIIGGLHREGMLDRMRRRQNSGGGTHSDIATLALKHRGSIVETLNHLSEYLNEIERTGLEMIDYTTRLGQIKMNEEIAKVITSKKLPKKALPWEFEEKGEQKVPILTGKFLLSDKEGERSFKGASVLDIYNSITAQIWHAEKADIKSKTFYFGQLHDALEMYAPKVAIIST